MKDLLLLDRGEESGGITGASRVSEKGRGVFLFWGDLDVT